MSVGVPLKPGKILTVFNETSISSIMKSKTISIDSEGISVSIFAAEVESSLLIKVYTLTEAGKELKILEFDPITSPTSTLIIERSNECLSLIKVEATVGEGDVSFEVRIRGIQSENISTTPITVIAGFDEETRTSSRHILGALTALIMQMKITNLHLSNISDYELVDGDEER